MKKSHQFWDTQPIAAGYTNFFKGDGSNPFWVKTPAIVYNPDTPTGRVVSPAPEEFLQTPMTLPRGYEWCELDVQNEVDLNRLCTFLRSYYATDPADNFRISYANETVLWNVTPPGYRKEWHVAVVKSDTKALVATIMAVPSVVRVLTEMVPLVQINFLCIRPSYRGKNLASLIIKEISRRVAIVGTLSAVYTTALELPNVLTSVSYYHRPLNIKKLIKVGFCYQHKKLTLAGTLKHYALPTFTPCKGLRALEMKDVEEARRLLNTYLDKLKIATTFTSDEFRHYFLPRDEVVWSYVVEEKGNIINLVSFYRVDTIAIRSVDKDQVIRSAYLSYVVDATIMPEVLTIAKRLKFDLFNCTGVMKNLEFTTACKFIEGTGRSHYYFYNFKAPKVAPQDMGVILI